MSVHVAGLRVESKTKEMQTKMNKESERLRRRRMLKKVLLSQGMSRASRPSTSKLNPHSVQICTVQLDQGRPVGAWASTSSWADSSWLLHSYVSRPRHPVLKINKMRVNNRTRISST